MSFVYQKALIQTFTPPFRPQNNLCEFTTQILKGILYKNSINKCLRLKNSHITQIFHLINYICKPNLSQKCIFQYYKIVFNLRYYLYLICSRKIITRNCLRAVKRLLLSYFLECHLSTQKDINCPF